MKTISRLAATIVATFAIAVGSSFFGSTAHADSALCENYLQWVGYSIDEELSKGCWQGQYGYVRLCQNTLAEANVIGTHAREACRRATL